MKGNEFLDKMELIDPAYVEAAAVAPQKRRRSRLYRVAAVAASLLLVLSLGFGTYAYAAEVREYNAAVQFFNDHDLSTEGLTRTEIKKVYRDITTKSFSYDKTAEVIRSSLTNEKVDGYEILQENPTPEELENLWNYKNYSGFFPAPAPEETGIHYKYRSEYTELIHFEGSYLEKYDGKTLLWSAFVPEFGIGGYSVVSDGVIAYGKTDPFSDMPSFRAWMAKFDENGTLIWKLPTDTGCEHEYVAEILENDDGSYTVISYGDFKDLCFHKYTKDGRRTHLQKTEIGSGGIRKIVRFDDGYLVQVGNEFWGNERIVKTDSDGNVTESFSYTAEDALYYITDMIEFQGKIYLSAYAVPKRSDDRPSFGGRYEISAILEYLYENNIGEISSEELTPMVRDNYTAILLMCDPRTGEPQEFFSAKGSLGGKLSLSDSGKLLWNVESITATFFSPATSSFTIGGSCYVFEYTFDTDGTLIGQKKTGEVTSFRR